MESAPAMPSLLTDSEILALFDSGFDVDMICLAYPEFALGKMKALWRRWYEKNHRRKKKANSRPCTVTDEKSDDASNAQNIPNQSQTPPSAKKKKKRRRRRA